MLIWHCLIQDLYFDFKYKPISNTIAIPGVASFIGVFAYLQISLSLLFSPELPAHYNVFMQL